MKVYYIDDDSDDLEFLTEILTGIDPTIQCIPFTNAKEALLQLKFGSTTPDLIILDINMPMVTGKDCLIEIKGDDQLRHIPVVMCSTTINTEEIKMYYELGAYDFIVKPSSVEKYHTELSAIIDSLKPLRKERVRE